jgi:hypothetical protein
VIGRPGRGDIVLDFSEAGTLLGVEIIGALALAPAELLAEAEPTLTPATKGEVVLDPQLTGSPFLVMDVVGRPASYSSAAEAPWKAAVRAEVTRAEQPIRDCRFGVSIAFRTPVATNANEVWDLDNLIKPTLDAMEGVFGARPWRGRPQAADDRVNCLRASKRTVTTGEKPGAHIEVFQL